MKKPLCKCGHGRSVHKYIYYGKTLSVRSPCRLCGKSKRECPVLDYITQQPTGRFAIIREDRCHGYRPMDNLTLIEHLAKKKGIT